jgi:oligoribonuclease (3'-5' exoribonuclease)
MTALIHLDMEFTSPDIELGEVMQIGMIAHEFNQEAFDAGDPDFFGHAAVEFKILCRVNRPDRASDWVIENQRALLGEACKGGEPDEFARNALLGYLVDVGEQFGSPGIIAGWCVANDYMFLKRFLPSFSGISYRTLEVEDIICGALGIFSVTDEDIREKLGVERDDKDKEHDALDDARFQMHVMREALRRSQRKETGDAEA